MQCVLIFIFAQLISVIVGTLKTVLTVNGGKGSAAFTNALNAGVGTLITLLTVKLDFNDSFKVVVAVLTTFFGVYAVKLILEKSEKEKLWIFAATIKDRAAVMRIEKILKDADVKLLYNEITEDLYSLQVFSYSKEDSSFIKSLLEKEKVKYFVLESKY